MPSVGPLLNEKLRRLAAANEALVLEYGGISVLARESSLSISTMRAGVTEPRSGHSGSLLCRGSN
ncbi:MAG: hypothetical protein C7B43_02775 [Sulfobacillus benefaciens]|uniref:Uncharacterized protein n=1 Tax=Sulfobacillus benefaciens TaxID=453960 RepID=A0A2T2X9Z9_9FIRM|nr:MAG: hypothetical protein C7B43_02775 [Sulfobacillus benefaciens]HBQ95145.1 hypothetical protein [Sulfobacillus sp.]